jgi:hypothetical protein
VRALAGLAVVIGLVAGLAAGCGAGSSPVPGPPAAARPAPPPATGAHSAPFVVVADSPSGVARATVPPGGHAVLAFRVANPSDAARTLALRAEGGWLTAPASVTVPARQSAVVPVGVAVGAGARPGQELRGALVARAQGRAVPGPRASLSYESAPAAVVRVGPRGAA